SFQSVVPHIFVSTPHLFIYVFFLLFFFFFFFNDPATTEIYTLSLHDALPIFVSYSRPGGTLGALRIVSIPHGQALSGHFRFTAQDRKSTRLNSSHGSISYAVFCLKKKKKT